MAFETFTYFNFMGHAIYSGPHKIEISERFKNQWTDFKGQISNLKHVEKNDEYKFNGKNVDIQMTNLMINCLFLTFSNVRLLQLCGADYSLSRKVEIRKSFKSHSRDFNGQSLSLKYSEKKFNGKALTFT